MKRTYQEIVAIITNVVNEWDPYGLISGGAPKDEFESEIAKIATKVLNIKSAASLAEVISSVFTVSFEPEPFSVEKCMPVASRLFAALKAHNLLEHEP